MERNKEFNVDMWLSSKIYYEIYFLIGKLGYGVCICLEMMLSFYLFLKFLYLLCFYVINLVFFKILKLILIW